LETRSGRSFWSDGNKTIYIIEQLQGANPPESAETWAELGRLAARLNSYTDYPYEYPIAVDGTIPELTRAAERYPFKNEFLELVGRLDVLIDQPVSLIHAEINPANSFRTPDGKIYILDWDSVGTGPAVLEAGYPLICCFIDESDLMFHHDWAAAYYESYTAGVGMTDDQKNLVFTAALLQALRYISCGTTTFQRWARICYALQNKALLLSAIPNLRSPAPGLPPDPGSRDRLHASALPGLAPTPADGGAEGGSSAAAER
jgi:Ser/Thr protein kinase RdoA (MazF antagonist)